MRFRETKMILTHKNSLLFHQTLKDPFLQNK